MAYSVLRHSGRSNGRWRTLIETTDRAGAQKETGL